MTDISKKFEQLITESSKKLLNSNQLLPVKTQAGIEVGNVLITSSGNLKHLWKHNKIVYNSVSLNNVAIKLANLLAVSKNDELCWKLYMADQEYGKWFANYQHLKYQHARALASKNFDRADILHAKYNNSRCKVELSLKYVNQLLVTLI